MTVKERIIKRLNNGFGFEIHNDAKWHTHERKYRDYDGMSWYFCDIKNAYIWNVGSATSATELLKCKRWVIDVKEREIFEYFEHQKENYERHGCLIEKI